MIITSLNNPTIKEISKLKNKKYRDLTNTYLAEGEHLVEEAYKNNILTKIILLEDTICNYDIEKIYVTKEVMKKLTELDTPNKIIGIVKKNTPLPIGNKILILDNIQDPGNLGTIIRSSVAFDIDTIVLSPNTVDIYNPKVIRSTQGMIFYTNIITLELKEFINEIKTKNYTIFGTNVRNGKNIKEITLPEKFALVLGNEGQGVSKEIESLCDDNIYIKMSSKCESLNVSVATSILLYEVYNK
ncbi:23S rRNA methyltransferase [Clostridium sp. CAG:914]|jgi:TrmH family RNA methyltransferase|nr:23S rRNA methyltransferase [Clostridium sp. CAG:914]